MLSDWSFFFSWLNGKLKKSTNSLFFPVPGRRDELLTEEIKEEKNEDNEIDILEEFLLSSFLKSELSRFLDSEPKKSGWLNLSLLEIMEEHIFT